MKILLTGAGGFLGKGMVLPFEEQGDYQLRLMDIVPFESNHEVVIGDVSDYADVERAVAGMDAVIIAHMAPRGENNKSYKTPQMPFDINVKGTANLFHAAVNAGITRVVLVSSQGVLKGHGPLPCFPHDLPPRTSQGFYSMSKVLQEIIAEQYSREHGIGVAALRVGYILDGEKNQDKYGRPVNERNFADTDRRDIGEVARLSLELADLSYETFNVMSTTESLTYYDVKYTCDRLGWKQQYDFSWLPAPENK